MKSRQGVTHMLITLIIIAVVFLIVAKLFKNNTTETGSQYPTTNISTPTKPSGDSLERKEAVMYAPGWLKIVKDCIRLVNSTKNPKVFFERYNLLIDNMKKLAQCERYVHFSGDKPSISLVEFRNKKNLTINDFIDRYFDDTKNKIQKLTTNKAKLNNANKFYNSLQAYYPEMSADNIDNIENKYKTLLAICETDKQRTVSTVNSKDLNSDKEISVVQTRNQNDMLPEWYVTISFNKSTSANFDKARYLAQLNPRYMETEYNQKIIYQATYSSDPVEFLEFIKVYDIVHQWKSTSFVINGQVVDKKTMGKIKWCYGDKCITGKHNFCFGASYMTDNPFGCHRLQISACNNPWWSFSEFRNGRYVIQKNLLRQRIDENSTAYQLCPAFNYNCIIERLNNLPDQVTKSDIEKFTLNAVNRRSSLLV